jgi:RHS repeat-associated protein
LKGGITASGVEALPGNTTNLQNFLNRTPGTNQPKAYLNWVLFDEQLKYVSSGADPVIAGGGYKLHDVFINTPASITKNGFLYVFVSNESNLPVYFDNLAITHTHGPILEETHYYPFGLTMAGISSKAPNTLQNKKGFNGNELQNKEFSDGSGLEAYDFNARFYDPQLGRFMQIDPESEEADQESWSPYHFGYNNAVRFSDPDGKFPIILLIPVAKAIGTAVVAAYATYKINQEIQKLREDGGGGGSSGQKFEMNTTDIYKPKDVVRTEGKGDKPKGSAENPHNTSRAARRDAMRKEGIPTSQPLHQDKETKSKEKTYLTRDKNHTVQDAKNDQSHQGQPHWEAGPTKKDPSKPDGLNRSGNNNKPQMGKPKSKSYYNE